MILETKFKDSFQMRQFYIDGFGTPIGLHCNKNDGAVMLFVHEDIPVKL